MLELVVVMAILAMAAAVGVVAMGNGWRTPRLRPYAQTIATELKAARATAILSNTPIAFVLNPAERSYRVGDNRSAIRIPNGIDLSMHVPDGSRGRIQFFADGSSNGGTVTVSMGGNTIALDVEWLTGLVRVR